MNAEDATVPVAVGQQATAIAAGIDVVADRLRAGGRLVYIGAGTSGRLGVLDATECPPTFNTRPEQVVGLIAGGPPRSSRPSKARRTTRNWVLAISRKSMSVTRTSW